MPREMSVAEAMELFGVSRRTIERWIEDGKLDSHKEGVRRIVVVSDEVVTEIDTPLTQASEPEPATSQALTVPVAAQLAALAARCEAQEAELTYLRGLVSQALQHPPDTATQRPGLWERIRAHLR